MRGMRWRQGTLAIFREIAIAAVLSGPHCGEMMRVSGSLSLAEFSRFLQNGVTGYVD